MQIENKIVYSYVFDGRDCEASNTSVVDVQLREPTVTIKKEGWVIDGVIHYRVDIAIGEGDRFTGEQTLADTHDEAMQLIAGTLTLDGVLLEVQDLSSIIVCFEPNSNHYLEYQCQLV